MSNLPREESYLREMDTNSLKPLGTFNRKHHILYLRVDPLYMYHQAVLSFIQWPEFNARRFSRQTLVQSIALQTTARVRAQFWTCGIYGAQSGISARFLRVLQFPLPILIPPVASQSPLSIIWGWYNRPVVNAVPSELSLTPLRIIKNNSLPKIRHG
jgi:hypothetical protein